MTDTIRRGTPVLYLPNGYLKRGRADVAALDPFDMGGVLTTRLASNWGHVPVAHLRVHPLAAEIAALDKAVPEDLDFPPPDCDRCNVATYHDGDGFACNYCLARWSSSGTCGVYPCVECGNDETAVRGADEQPRCVLCEIRVRTAEIDPTGPYQCRDCKRDVHGIGWEFRSKARVNRRCGGCQQFAENHAYMETLRARYSETVTADALA